MSSTSKNKLLTWLVIILLIANAVTITMFWLNKKKADSGTQPPPPKGSPGDFFARELGLDSMQKMQVEKFVMEHRATAEAMRKKIRAAKEAFFELLKEANVSDSIKHEAAMAVSKQIEELDLITFDHFKKVRALCNPEQQKKFDGIIGDVIRTMGQPPPPMRPGGPPHEGPPPGDPSAPLRTPPPPGE